MAKRKAATASSERIGHQEPDQRFAALARLLARDLAKKHSEQDSQHNELSRSPADAYDVDSPSGDTS